MTIFSSYFWLWSIIGLLGFLMLYTFGSLMNFAGFLSPVKAVGQRLDAAAPRTRLIVLAAVIVLLGYPSAVHKLWADATASEIRREFQTIQSLPGTVGSDPTEQWGGLYDPTGTDGAYIVGWFGTSAGATDVQAHYRNVLRQKGWVEQTGETRALRFLDSGTPAQSHYELVLAVAPSGSLEAPAAVTGQPTVYAVRLGVVDPRVTTQIAWLVDCLVRAAPTFPSCEAMGWHPLESAGTLPASRGLFGR